MELAQNNPYRIAGILSNATERELQKQKTKIKAYSKVGNESILENHPDIEDYLEQDIISESYLSRLQDDFFDTHITNEFELISRIDDDILKSLKDENEA